MFSKQEVDAAVVHLANVEQLLEGLKDGDEDAEMKAVELILDICELENGVRFVLTGVGVMMNSVIRDADHKEDQQ